MAGRDSRIGVGLDAGNDAHQAWLAAPGADDPLKAVDVVVVVDDHQANAVVDGHLQVFVGFRIAVQHHPSRIGPGRQSGDDLAAAGHVEQQPFFGHQALNGGAGKGLRREGHVRSGPTVAKSGEIVAGALADSVLGDDHHRGAELLGERRQPATADNQLALVVDERTGREQSEYVDHRSCPPRSAIP
jgi:hypothetical protein